MKAPFVIYADFKALLRMIQDCAPPKEQEESFTIKTEMHKACGFAYTILRSPGRRRRCFCVFAMYFVRRRNAKSNDGK